jgi:branched-chain amino acid transport system ATP-binding protein
MKTLLEVRGLTSHYGRVQALHGIDLEVREGELVALVGANGAGKTTLLRSLSGVQPASGGSLHFDGHPIADAAPAARVRLGICQVPEGRQVFGPMTVEDNLRLGAFVRKDATAIRDDLARMYALFPILREFRLRPAGSLSGGQQQMLALARAMMGQPRLLLLDEPSLGLAPRIVASVLDSVAQLARAGMAVLLVEQNARAALQVAQRAYVLELGVVTMAGAAADLAAEPRIVDSYLGMKR